MLKTSRNPALVTLNARTSAELTGNAAVVAALTTPEVTSQPKSTIIDKLLAGLARDGSTTAFVVIDPLHSYAVSVVDATAKTAVKTAVAYGSAADLASVIAESVSSSADRAKFLLADDTVDVGYNRPENIVDEDTQQLVDTFAPIRPTVAWSKAVSMFSDAAVKAGKALSYDQTDGTFKMVDSIAKATMLTAIPAPSAAGTAVYDVVEDADTVANSEVIPPLGG